MRELQDVKLEITYTGKAFAGLVADARSGRLAGAGGVLEHLQLGAVSGRPSTAWTSRRCRRSSGTTSAKRRRGS